MVISLKFCIRAFPNFVDIIGHKSPAGIVFTGNDVVRFIRLSSGLEDSSLQQVSLFRKC